MKIIYQGEKAKNVEKFHEICLHTSTYFLMTSSTTVGIIVPLDHVVGGTC